ncbi:Pr6Pr family membrane protein, partial [Bacillus sp. S34]|nr:Pr6Pr family membrane protein [Bacillus sp. S34]
SALACTDLDFTHPASLAVVPCAFDDIAVVPSRRTRDPRDVNVQWSIDILHKVLPAYAVLDWLLFSDRSKLLLRHVWWFLIYPAVWTIVVLVRGATDGWVPYPFLNPDLGYGIVALYCLGVAVSIVLLGVLVIGMSRLRLVKV